MPDNDSPEWIVLGGGGTARGVKATTGGLRQRGQGQDGGDIGRGVKMETQAEGSGLG